LIYAKETICAVANQHGMTASFLPKLLADQAGNGCHCHFSLVDNSGNNATSDSERRFSLSAMGEAFAAGIVAHLPSIMPFAAANPNSYHRIAPSTWSGAYHCWGVNNREAPCRLVGLAGRPDTVNFELKAMDGTANPHLCLVALIAAGLRGVREGMLLPETVQVDPATLPAEKRPQRLPPTLGESLRLLDCDTEFKAAFAEAAHSDVLLRVYAAVKCSECDVLEGMSLPEQVERLSARF
jgi:glutamine synthetase